MSGLCLLAGALAVALPVQAFTLGWEHSVEHQRWEEDWRIEDARLVLVEARISGSGAGMDPPEGAWLSAGVWHYRSERRLARLILPQGAGQAQHRLCAAGTCRGLGDWLGAAGIPPLVELAPCP